MKRHLPFSTLPLAALALAGCTQFPALDHTMTDEVERADYPALVPIEPLIVGAQHSAVDPAATQANLQSRLASLRARADGLRGSVLTGREKLRLQNGLQ